MIKGLTSGYVGTIYIFYRGPMQVVLSDVHGSTRMGPDDLAATALRIVLQPNQWTECDYSSVKGAFESSRGQLYFLEKSGMVDIYTDKREVDLLKQGKTQEEIDTLKNSSKTDNTKSKYFNMQMFTDNQNSAPSQAAPVQNIEATNTFLKQNELMQKQMEAMTQMTQAMASLINKLNDKLDK